MKFFHKRACDPTAIYAYCDGTVCELEDVMDPIFSQKMMGDGFAVIPDNGELVAPFDGVVTMIFPTKHAIGLRRADGLELLIHVGLDTVSEQGRGFTCLVKEQDHVKCGDGLLNIDRDALLEKGYDLTTPCVITNGASFSILERTQSKSACKGKTIMIKTGKL